MNPLPPAALLLVLKPEWWPVAAAAALFRAAAGWAAAEHAVRDPLTRRLWWLIPLADAANSLAWVAGFFGSAVEWRGRKYYLKPDGRFAPE
jgi:ceramide glucosyltransferase